MDTSEQYIKMCEKAGEIQGNRELLEGDFYAYIRPKEGFNWLHHTRQEFIDNPSESWAEPSVCMLSDDRDYGIEHIYEDVIERCWLPRQDQLQEMLLFPCGDFKDNFWSALDDFRDYAFSETFIPYIPTSMEQLWLCYVMKQKYGKAWNGADWLGS